MQSTRHKPPAMGSVFGFTIAHDPQRPECPMSIVFDPARVPTETMRSISVALSATGHAMGLALLTLAAARDGVTPDSAAIEKWNADAQVACKAIYEGLMREHA